jgi:hypothetical protein
MSRVPSVLLLATCLTGAVTTLTAQPAHVVDEVATLEAIELPVSLERIRRKLDRLPISEDARLELGLNYYIEVYGRSPRVNVLDGFDVHNGPIPYFSSHAELMSVMTPREFQPTVANIGAVLGWSWDQLKPGR